MTPALESRMNPNGGTSSSSSSSKEDSATAQRIESYGATTECKKDDEDVSLLQNVDTEEETQSLAAGTTTGASSLISNASSSASHYFQQHQQLQHQSQSKPPGHDHSDSLDYSTTSSTNSIHLPQSIHTNEDSLSTRNNTSYLGSIVRSLGPQQAFPSSMFPGQKLISPVHSRETIQDGYFENNQPTSTRSTPSASSRLASYYYFTTSSTYKDSHRSNSSGSPSSSHQSHSYQNARSNVYQKRPNNHQDFELYNIEDESRQHASWRKCRSCFFSPRVLVTLVVCGVIVLNLLRLGEHRHHRATTNTNPTSSSIRKRATSKSSSSSISDIDAEYVKLEVIGGNTNIP